MRVVALIPAHNEQGRVGAVVDVVRRSAGLAAVIVVDDGSTDGTAAEARAAGAQVISLSPNRGKGGAMRAALGDPRLASASHVLFLDADLVGLRPDHLGQMLSAAADPTVAMVLGDRDYGPLNTIVAELPAITGERIVRRDVLAAVGPDEWRGFRVEAGINEAARRVGGRVVRIVLDGVSVVAKWQKAQRHADGARDAALMLREVLAATAEARARVRVPPPSPWEVDCVVPAHNEAGRVAAVIEPLRASGVFRRILVVDDGSTDRTAAEARTAGAQVMSLSPNRGKGGAMREGVASTRGPWVAFFDADMIGLTPDHVRAMADAARSGRYGMVTGTLTYAPSPTAIHEAWALYGLDLSGQRFVRRDVLDRLPRRYWEGYGIEVALDESCSRSGYACLRMLLRGLDTTRQHQKLGHEAGRAQVARILSEALRAVGAVRSDSSW